MFTNFSDPVYNDLYKIYAIFWALSQLRVSRPPPTLRSGHLDIKDPQCANKNDECQISYHIAFGRVQKGHCVCLKIQLSSKVAKKK